jgi:parvulin-like peptidyl-prolyl isomerase
MPSSAPRSVKLGVVLVTYAGAEGAPNHARPKKDAIAIAERLVPDAKADFHKAVTNGDPGSSDDIGRLPRGVLDPRTEVAVFALNAGEVSDVLETPRGYWIVKRIE